MLEYLVQLPYEVVGHRMLGFLEFHDIMQLENAALSHKSQKLMQAILPFSPPVVISDSTMKFKFTSEVNNWFNNRQCPIKLYNIPIEALKEIDIEPALLNEIEVYLKPEQSLENVELLKRSNINEKVTSIRIEGDQDPDVMEVLFSSIHNIQNLSLLELEPSSEMLWVEIIKKIGSLLYKLSIDGYFKQSILFHTITEYCSNLREFRYALLSNLPENNILLNLATNCLHLRTIHLHVKFPSKEECNVAISAFIGQCSQVEELKLVCSQLTDQAAIAISQYCTKLKKLQLSGSHITITSMIALSERSLPLEDLIISSITFPNTENARQCAHALSCIRELNTEMYQESIDNLLCGLEYMTGLRVLVLDSSEDHELMPHLLRLPEHCAGLVDLTIGEESSITTEQLVELSSCCPHMQKSTIDSSELTEEDVLALAVHCRDLRDIILPQTTVTIDTVRQLAQHCRRLTKVQGMEDEDDEEQCQEWSRKTIRELLL